MFTFQIWVWCRQNCGRLFSYMCAYVTSTTGKNGNSSRKENVSVNLKKAIKEATDESHNFDHESDDHYHYLQKVRMSNNSAFFCVLSCSYLFGFTSDLHCTICQLNSGFLKWRSEIHTGNTKQNEPHSQGCLASGYCFNYMRFLFSK